MRRRLGLGLGPGRVTRRRLGPGRVFSVHYVTDDAETRPGPRTGPSDEAETMPVPSDEAETRPGPSVQCSLCH